MTTGVDTELSIWKKNLEFFSSDVQVFSPDCIQSIPTYSSRTQITTHIVSVLEDLRKKLETKNDRALNTIYKTVKSELVELVKDRIGFIQSGEKTTHPDFWKDHVQSKRGELVQRLQLASAKFQDVYFMCKTVVQHRFVDKIGMCIKDINQYQLALKKDVEFFKRNNFEEEFQTKSEEIASCFDELSTALEEKDFSKSSNLLQKISQLSQT